MERIVEFSPAYDKRHSDPKQNYGIGAVEIRFLLKGALGAMQFLLGTDWYPRELQASLRRKDADRGWFGVQPMPWDIGYHSRVPRHEGQGAMGPCEYLDGATCWYDGSSLQAEPIRDALLERGDAGVWDALEKRYIDTFGELK